MEVVTGACDRLKESSEGHIKGGGAAEGGGTEGAPIFRAFLEISSENYSQHVKEFKELKDARVLRFLGCL